MKLKLLEKTHAEYKNIKTQFTTKWLKGASIPTLERIYVVNVPESAFDAHLMCRERVASKIGREGAANVMRQFHGTSSKCNVGVNIGRCPRSAADCNVCSIITRGFQRAGSGTAGDRKCALRYEKGIYCSATSSQANDYVSVGHDGVDEDDLSEKNIQMAKRIELCFL